MSSPRSATGTRRGERGLQRVERTGVLAPQVHPPWAQPVAKAAIVIDSIRANGSPSIRTRSLNVPGSDSSALHTRWCWPRGLAGDGIPLAAGRERRPAAPDEPGVGDLRMTSVGPIRERPSQGLVPAGRPVVVEARGVDPSDSSQQHRATGRRRRPAGPRRSRVPRPPATRHRRCAAPRPVSQARTAARGVADRRFDRQHGGRRSCAEARRRWVPAAGRVRRGRRRHGTRGQRRRGLDVPVARPTRTTRRTSPRRRSRPVRHRVVRRCS